MPDVTALEPVEIEATMPAEPLCKVGLGIIGGYLLVGICGLIAILLSS